MSKGSNKRVTKKTSKKTKQSIEETFQKMDPHEHVLELPDTYVGSIEEDNIKMWVYDEDTNKIVFKNINYVPGLYKIFDEIVVNARDHSIRDKTCTVLKITINPETGEITCMNNGENGIPIAIHKEHKIYIPELIFGNLLTSGNYRQKGKIVGGKNGYGAKLCCKKGTMIPTFDGEIKKIEDIELGEKLIGDNGTSRTVINRIEGNGKLFEVTQQRCDPYIVNEDHILCLRMPDHKVIFWNETEYSWTVLWVDKINKEINKKSIRCYPNDTIIYNKSSKDMSSNLKQLKNVHESSEVNDKLEVMKQFIKNIPDDNTIDISVKDYLKLPQQTRKRLVGYIGKCVQWDYKKVELDPYVLGLWLGDGFTINSNTNLKKLLSTYNLIHNKHIPKEYLINSRNIRLKVLAGLIDSNGYVIRDYTRITITQEMNEGNKKLVEDIVFLTKSLGLLCYFHKTHWKHNNELKNEDVIKINIIGEDIKDIPTKITRKKCCFPVKINTTDTGTLNVKEVESGDFIGLAIDGNQRFVLNDFTVTHNCNIFSTHFYIEAVDNNRKLKYTQHFYENMYKKDEPTIKKYKNNTSSYIKIGFTPDFSKFGIDKLTDDHVALFKKRVCDLAACTSNRVKVYLNDKLLNINSFEDYVKMFYNGSDDEENHHFKSVYEESNERWKVCAIFDPNSGYKHISYVNGICTFQGGSHVNHVMDQIVGGISKFISEKHKGLNVKNAHIRDNLTVFIDATIEDPSFSSQIKENLTTKVANFGSRCELTDDFTKKLAQTGLVSEVVDFAKLKAMAELKKTDGKKTSSVRGLAKLKDAHWAGGRKSKFCRLILTEGDSAKGFAVSGTDIIGKDRYGVFPLKGKLLNVRDATPNQLKKNEEIINIKKIMGLKHGKKYTDINQLRYGGIIILTDQDVDGSHIKGLLINFIHYFWPSLLKVDGFIQSMATPIVKAWKTNDTKKKNPKIFYTLTEYENWRNSLDGSLKSKGWKIKYYKGLGTSTEKEAKECFNDFENRLITYIWEGNEDNDTKKNNKIQLINMAEDDENNDELDEIDDYDSDDSDDDLDKKSESYNAITLAFSKNRTHDRKTWLLGYDKEDILENDMTEINYSAFIHKELKHFSFYDIVRSIPSICDGFKPSQRKILYGAFLRKILKDEVKVAQLAGFVSDRAAYHHGEASLMGAIISMAQDFVGSNNINLLMPNGNFGSRALGGKDHASPRYIFTQLTELTPLIFRKEDDCIYDYVNDDGSFVEPVHYLPIIPMILVNGTGGIGTGFSTRIPCFNPTDIINNIKKLLKGHNTTMMYPWYMGFKGKLIKLNSDTFQTKGIYDPINANTLVIEELPVGVWTEKYVDFLDSITADDPKKPKRGQIIKEFQDDCGNNTIKIKITFLEDNLSKLIKNDTIDKVLRLANTIKITNMHLHTEEGGIKKYKDIDEILRDFYESRINAYTARKKYYLKQLKNDLDLIAWKIKFLQYVINGKIIVFEKKKAKKKEDVIKRLVELKFPKLSTKLDSNDDDKTYNYITNIPLFALTEDELEKLTKQREEKQADYYTYKETSEEDIWLSELLELEKAYNKWLITRDDNTYSKRKSRGKYNVKSKTKKH